MAPRTLTFATSLAPDPPLQQGARYVFDTTDRQSIDTQIRATQTFLSVDVINGKAGTYVPFVGDDGAVGDVVCSGGGLGGKPTVTLATDAALLLSGVMFGILTEACVEGNKAHVVTSGILGPEITGLAAGDEGWVRVNANRCEKVTLLSDVDVCVGYVDKGGFLRVGAQPVASVTGAAPPSAKYLINAATVPAALTDAVPILALPSTLIFASTAAAPIEARRTDSATAADVDVGYLEALSSGTTAAGFGPAWRFYAKKGAGGAETTGTISLPWTNVSGGTEASKFVVKTRTAGGAAAMALEVSETEVKATALAGVGTRFVTVTSAGVLGAASAVGASDAAKYLTDSATSVNASDVPIQALPSTLAFAKTSEKLASFTVTAAAGSVYESIGVGHVVSASGAGTTGDGVSIAARLVDATPSVRRVGRIRWEWISPVALTPRADFVVSVLSTDGEHDWLRLTDDGSLRLPAYNIAGRRPIFAGTDGTITATAIQFGEVQTAFSGLAAGVLHEDGAGVLSSSAIVNADVDAAAAIAGTKISPDFGSQAVATTGAVTITKDALGTTKTRGFTSANTTASGSQVSAQIGLSASHSGGTPHNIGWQIEPQSASNALSVWYHGTGTGVPGSTAFYHASSDGNFGSAMFADAWVCRSTSTTGFRFDQSSNRGGMDQDGSNNLRLKSYSGKGITLSIYSDAGSTLASNPITVNGSGQGYAQFIPTTPTSASNALTINLTTSQHADHALTEDTTVTITGGVNGQEGTIVFSQPASAKTVTMPTNGVGVEYANDIIALTTTGIIDTTNLTRTVLSYRVLANGKAFIKHRAVGLIP